MSPSPTVNQVPAVIWIPSELQKLLAGMEAHAALQHHAVALEVPHPLLKLLADPTQDKTCFLVELQGMTTGLHYALLTMQVGDTQLTVVAPLSSARARAWLQQVLKPQGRFHFLLSASGADDLAVMSVPYFPDESDADMLRVSLELASSAASKHSPSVQLAEFQRLVTMAEMRAHDTSLLDGVFARERHIVAVQPSDWPTAPTGDGSTADASVTLIVQNQSLH